MTVLAAGATAKAAVTMLAMMAAQGTVLALLALALVRAGRLRPSWQAAVWLVVLAKFVLPWGPALPWSLSDVIAYLRHDGGDAAIAFVPTANVAEGSTSIAPAIGWIVLAAAWALGAAVVLGRSISAHRAARRDARAGGPAPGIALDMLANLACDVGVRMPALAVGDDATGPYVVGALRPIIVVPPALFDDRALLRAALLHELAHVRRRDAIWRVVQMLASAVFFFWPIVRLVGRRLDLAREAACDAVALETGDLSRPAYARLLVRMAALRTAAAPALGSPSTLEARVAAVLGPPARARLGLVHRLALLAWVALALGGARTATARGQATVCRFTPQIAEAMYQAYPEADVDGDGTLSRDEACEFQAELRRRVETTDQVSTLEDEAELERMLGEPLCCNCDPGDGLIPSSGSAWTSVDTSCQRAEGVDR
jgi:beta-lactamase regulating signal transducer with metallopeptidase domain